MNPNLPTINEPLYLVCAMQKYMETTGKPVKWKTKQKNLAFLETIRKLLGARQEIDSKELLYWYLEQDDIEGLHSRYRERIDNRRIECYLQALDNPSSHVHHAIRKAVVILNSRYGYDYAVGKTSHKLLMQKIKEITRSTITDKQDLFDYFVNLNLDCLESAEVISPIALKRQYHKQLSSTEIQAIDRKNKSFISHQAAL